MRITELLSLHANNTEVAIKCGDEELSYQEWHNRAIFISNNLSQLSKAKCVGLFLPNSIDYALGYFGIAYDEKIIVPIGTQAKSDELKSTLTYCEIDLIVSNSQFVNQLQTALEDYKYQLQIYLIDLDKLIIVNYGREWVEKSSNDELTIEGTVDDVALMLHTSGTTSNPKRVMLTHDNLISNIESNIESLELTRKDKVLITLPMYFGYCNTAQFLTHLKLGATIIILNGIFFPKNFFKLVQDEQITTFTTVPTMLLMINDYKHYSKYDYSSLRYICFGGGRMPTDKLIEMIHKYPGVGFVQTYGQTECSPRVTALLPNDSLTKIGSIGKPIPGVVVKIIDQNGLVLPKNEIGEVVVQGKNVMKGYYKRQAATDEVMKNGFLLTGDLGYEDSEGFFYLVGRKRNVIISGGINIYPEEIEEILLKNIFVEEAYVFGEFHPILGEVPVSRVVLKTTTTSDDLRTFCLSKLASYKVPVRFNFVEKIEKTYNGKIKRENAGGIYESFGYGTEKHNK